MRKATSMIELVFAIVVMGIAMMSLPLILTQVQNSNTFTLRQEAILSIKTKLTYVLAYQWDTNTLDATANIERALDIPSSSDTDANFDRNTTLRRVGHLSQDARRRFWNNQVDATTTASFGTVNTPQDIDDFNGDSETKSVAPSALDDFIFNLELNTSVAYIVDKPSSGSYAASPSINFIFDTNTTTNRTNIKMIRVMGNANGMDAPIYMYTFSSNIGESKVAKRTW